MARNTSKQPQEPDAPITGVAAGSLGTAANLDDTQVISIAELQAAARDADVEPAPQHGAAPITPDHSVPRDPALEAAPTAVFPVGAPTRSAPTSPAISAPEAAPVVATTAPVTRARAGSTRLPALAGIVAAAVLVLVAGAGILSTLDFSAAGAPALGTDVPNVAPTTDPATPRPKDKEGRGGGGHGHGGCHGHGCNGPGED